MQTNLDQNAVRDNRAVQDRYQAQPLHADMLIPSVPFQPEPPLAPSVDLFQQVFDDALQQQPPQETTRSADDPARGAASDPYRDTWEPRSTEAPGSGKERSATTEPRTQADKADGQDSGPMREAGSLQNREAPVSRAKATQADGAPRSDAPAQTAAGNGNEANGKNTSTNPAGDTPSTAASNGAGTTGKTVSNATVTAAVPGLQTEGVRLQGQAAGNATIKQTLAQPGSSPEASRPGAPSNPEAPASIHPAKPALQVPSSVTVPEPASAVMASKLAAAFPTLAQAKPTLPSDAATSVPSGVTGITSGLEISGSQMSGAISPTAPTAPGAAPGNGLTGQIAQSMQAAVRSSSRELVVQLHPVELGRIAIRFRQDGDQLVGLIQVGERQVRADIEQAIPQILQNLEQNGTQIRRIDVVLQGDSDTPLNASGEKERETNHPEAGQRESSPETPDGSADEDEQESKAGTIGVPHVTSDTDLSAGRVNMLL